MDDAGLPALKDAIRHMHGCEAAWVEAVPVKEVFHGETVWEGEVHVFDVVGHPKAKRVYAWSETTDGSNRRFHAVLHLAAIDSAEMAVRAAIRQAARERHLPRQA